MTFFASNLKILMERYNISGKRLGVELDLSDSAISSYQKKGVYPKVETLLKICTIFKTDLNTLFDKDLTQFDFSTENQIELKNIDGVIQVANGNGGDVHQRTGASEEVYERFLKSQDERIAELKEYIDLLKLKNKLKQ